jgi:hypothetical protein
MRIYTISLFYIKNFFLRLTFLLLVTSLVSSSCRQFNPDMPSPSGPGLITPENTPVNTAVPNMSTELNNLYAGWLSGEYKPDQLPESPSLEYSGDRVKVTLIMLDEGFAHQAEKILPGLGVEVLISYGPWIDAWVPISKLGDLARLPGISLVREPVSVMP